MSSPALPGREAAAAGAGAAPPVAPRYSGGAIALHWLHALLVLALIGIGLAMGEMPKGAERSAAIALHKSLGLLALALLLLRLGWRLRHRPPVDNRLGALERKLAGLGHRALYLLLLLTPLAGYLSSSFTPYPMRFFGIVIPKAGWPDEGWNALFNALHTGCAWTLIGLIALHLGAVVLHALSGRSVLGRMLPGRGRR